MSDHIRILPLLACTASTALTSAAPSTPIDASFSGPTIDRWMYPFNPSPGSRTTASTFGALLFDPPEFDNRDGQLLLAFTTASQVPAGLGAASYAVTSAVMTLQNDNDLVFVYDPTPDPYTAFLPADDPEFTGDADPGQALELFGAGYRGGFTTMTFAENATFGFGDPTAPGVRNAYALGFDASGAAVDVSNSVRERWNPVPFGVGVIAGLSAGDFVPAGSTITFTIDVDDPHIQAYLQAALHVGKLDFCLSSHTFVEPMGGAFPSFYMKENPLVIDGIAEAAQLMLTVAIDEGGGCASDITDAAGGLPDGTVDVFDLLMLLANWNTSGSGAAISDAGGGANLVDVFDLLDLLDAWGDC